MPEDRTNKVSCNNYRCEIEITLEVISGKWNALIVWTLGTDGKKRFGELKKSISGITQKMLTQQLKSLEKHGIVNRVAYDVSPPVVEYSLTERGQKLIPILIDMDVWGKAYIKDQK